MSLSVELPRLRAAAAGGVCGVTAVAAHAQAHGELPGLPALLAVTATAALLALLVHGRRPSQRATTVRRGPIRLLPMLMAGQLLIHLLLIALTGAHHQLLTGAMTLTHTGGTLLALALIAVGELLLGAVAALARRVVALTVSGVRPRRRLLPAAESSPTAPAALLFLGTVGTRGPPAFV